MNYDEFVENLEYFGYRKYSLISGSLNDGILPEVTKVSWKYIHEHSIKTKDLCCESLEVTLTYTIRYLIISKQFTTPNEASLLIRRNNNKGGYVQDLITIELKYAECIKLILDQKLVDINILRDIKLNKLGI